ncbi:MAG: hypothetical protein J6B33_04260 [Prevotella sp.]|nr:hypothetical protein [Prevotella sp.]
MKQKVFFLLTLLIWGGISVSARNINADLSKGEVKGDGATWTAGSDGSYTLTWTAADQYVSLFKAFGGKEGGELDWSDGTNFNINTANNTGITSGQLFSVSIVANGKTFIRTMYSAGEKNLIVTGTDEQGNGFRKDGWSDVMTAEDAKHITDVKVVGCETSTNATIDVSASYITISSKATLAFGADGKATIDLSKIEAYGGATYDYATQTITSDGTAGSYIEVVFDKAYDFTNMDKGAINISGTDIGNNLEFTGSGHNGGFYSSKYNPTFAGEIAKGNYTTVTGFKLYLNNTAGEMTITDISLTATNPMTITDAHSTLIETLPNYAVDNVTGEVKEDGKLPTQYNIETDLFFGNGNGEMKNFVDIEAYDELRIYSEANALRVFLFNQDPKAGLSGTPGNLYTISKNATNDYFKYNTERKYYYATISDIKANNNNHAKIISVKSSGWGVKAKVSKITLYNEETTSEYDYTVSGQYSDAVSLDDIANSDACTIDCTGLTGADVKIGSKNPNCIIAVKKEGVVSATKNLAVNGKIANLELTDGHSVKIPAGMTAGNVKYTRTMTNTYGTIVLPFDAASDDNVEFYTISAMDENSITIERADKLSAGTPAIIKKLVSDDITITGNGSTLNGNINNTTGAVNMFGSYTQDEKIADENAYYILDNKFWQCNEYFYCDAFRAYFTPAAGAPAANCLSLKESFGNPTLVNIVTGNTANGIQGVYNTAGVKMQGLQKGINIVRLASGETKTVIIK